MNKQLEGVTTEICKYLKGHTPKPNGNTPIATVDDIMGWIDKQNWLLLDKEYREWPKMQAVHDDIGVPAKNDVTYNFATPEGIIVSLYVSSLGDLHLSVRDDNPLPVHSSGD